MLGRQHGPSMQAAEALLSELGLSRGRARKGRPLGLADLLKWAARMEVCHVFKGGWNVHKLQ